MNKNLKDEEAAKIEERAKGNKLSDRLKDREKENIERRNETKERKVKRATNRNLRSRHKSVSSPPPTTSLIFHALSTPTQSFHNTHPQKKTREKKKEIEKD